MSTSNSPIAARHELMHMHMHVQGSADRTAGRSAEPHRVRVPQPVMRKRT